MMQKQTQFQYLRDEWHRMSIYQRFESERDDRQVATSKSAG